jgi:hypothetical protein
MCVSRKRWDFTFGGPASLLIVNLPNYESLIPRGDNVESGPLISICHIPRLIYSHFNVRTKPSE